MTTLSCIKVTWCIKITDSLAKLLFLQHNIIPKSVDKVEVKHT